MEPKHTCIYCKEEKSYKEFNSEHVFHKAFGTFGTNTPTLINKVCKACNDYFANKIDLALRNTYEGNERFNRGIKPCKEYVHAKHSKNVIRTAMHGYLKGQELVLAPSRDGSTRECSPKNGDVAFRKIDGTYDFYSIDQLPNKEKIDREYPPHDEWFKVKDSDLAKTLKEKLEKMGYQMILEEESNDIDTRARYPCPPEVLQAIAKIAFNYLAHSNESAILLRNCFDPIRNFIRNGVGCWENFVSIDANPIVPDENVEAFSMHLITTSTFGSAIVVSVSLFNIFHYRILLTSNYNGQPIKTGYGEFFNPHDTGIKRGKLGMSQSVPIKS